MSLVSFICPRCAKQLRAPENYAGRRVQCTSPLCRHIFIMPQVQSLEPVPLRSERRRPATANHEPREHPVRRAILISLAAIFLIVGSGWGLYWWVGQPSSAQVAAFEGFLRTGNELYDLQLQTKTEAQAQAAETRIMSLAEEHLEFRKQIEQSRGRKRRNLADRFESRIQELSRKVAGLLQADRPIMVFLAMTPRNGGNLVPLAIGSDQFKNEGGAEFTVLRMGWYSGSKPAPPPTPATTGTPTPSAPPPPPMPKVESPKTPEELLRSVEGVWDAPDITFTIAPGGVVKSVISIYHDSQRSICFNTTDIVVKDKVMTLTFKITLGMEPTEFEFTLSPGATSNELSLREKNGRIKPNPVTMKRRDPNSGIAAAPSAPAPKPSAADSKLDGEWKLDLSYRVFTAGEKDYLAVSRDHVMRIKEGRVEIQGTVSGSKTIRKYTMELDAKASPNKYRILGADAMDFEEGVCSLDGDKLLMKATRIGSAFPEFSFSGISLSESGGSTSVPAGLERRRGDKGYSVLEFRRVASK